MSLPQTTGEIESLRALAYNVLRRDPASRDAHLRLYEVEQMLGQPAAALAHLRMALRASRIVTLPAQQQPPELTLLALSRVARWEANAPLELIVDPVHTTLHRLYIDDDDSELPAGDVPPYDVLFNAIGESELARPALALAQRFAERAGITPVNPPPIVAQLGRTEVAQRFADSATILAPAVERVEAAVLRARDVTLPLLVRPVGSQAGFALARVDDAGTLRAYLEEHAHDAYFITPFIDYRNEDGFYRKYRVMFVGGVAYPCHLAISPRWMIHYYNAAMAEHRWMRDEEARYIAHLDAVFNGSLRAALAEIVRAVPLDYFGIDCAVAPDGRLLLFEADAAMLVHGTDPPELYPYKRTGFQRIQTALMDLLYKRRR
ncbi:MAG: RimK family alpha-L-glutamate ligase [Candidatus Lustribacter sp.]